MPTPGSAPATSRTIKRRASEVDDDVSPCNLSNTSQAFPINKRARERFFEALGSGNKFPGMARDIRNADGLSKQELLRLFETLHACGKATDLNANLRTTRDSMESFLEAIFMEWNGNNVDEPVKPQLEFLVEADVVAGRVCSSPDRHTTLVSCLASETCNQHVTALSVYSSNPPLLKTEFTVEGPTNDQPAPICPIRRKDIRWNGSEWAQALRQSLLAKIVSRLHRHNKHLAIWQARRLIQDWAKGGFSMTVGEGEVEYLTAEDAQVALSGASPWEK